MRINMYQVQIFIKLFFSFLITLFLLQLVSSLCYWVLLFENRILIILFHFSTLTTSLTLGKYSLWCGFTLIASLKIVFSIKVYKYFTFFFCTVRIETKKTWYDIIDWDSFINFFIYVSWFFIYYHIYINKLLIWVYIPTSLVLYIAWEH